MRPLDKTAWEVLNATADDWENLEQIYQLLHAQSAGGSSLEDVADRVCLLMRSGLLEGRDGASGHAVSDLNDLRFVWRAWFRMTPEGRTASAESEWAKLVQQEQHS